MNDTNGMPAHPHPHHAHRRPTGSASWVRTAAFAGAGAVAGVLAVVAYNGVAGDPQQTTARDASTVATSVPDTISAASHETVTQTGRVTAISAGWVTAQSSDGFTQTYRLAPDTTAVTVPAGGNGPISEQFAVDQLVTIVATVSGDTATATAVADQAGVGPQGVPQDYALP